MPRRQKMMLLLPAVATYSHALSDSDRLQELEVLCVAGADLHHHAGRVAGGRQGVTDLVDL